MQKNTSAWGVVRKLSECSQIGKIFAVEKRLTPLSVFAYVV